jgi:hypothetical protein
VSGDIVVSLPGNFAGKRRYLREGIELTPDLAEIIGLYIGDGSLSLDRPKRFKIVFDPQDKEARDNVVERFNSIPLGLDTQAYCESERSTENLRLNSAAFADIMVNNKLNSKTCPQDAEIPPIVLQSDKDVLCAFLRGLFDADGWCYQSSTNLKLGFSSSSKKLAEQVQVALHSIGVVARRKMVADHKPGRYSSEPYWRVDVYDADSKIKYRELIGFTTPRKQKPLDTFDNSNEHFVINHPVLVREFASMAIRKMLNSKTFRECQDARKWNLYRIRRNGKVKVRLVRELSDELGLDDRLSNYVRNGFFFDTVEQTYDGSADLFDLSVPENNTYLANGMVSHNTLQHGGSIIVISTTNGVGNWYWRFWSDAATGENDFNPIIIDWWDMTWKIKYHDELAKKNVVLAPTKDIRPCKTAEEMEKYGPYWSPWLEREYRGLTEKGNDSKFRQEVLADFIGTGNTVLSRQTLTIIKNSVDQHGDEYQTVGEADYVNPVTGEREILNFDNDLWVWAEPIRGKMDGEEMIEPPHQYVMGCDTATGEGDDFSAIEVFDLNEGEQVAELKVRVRPKIFAKMIDYVGRWYNNAIAVVENTGIGEATCHELHYDLAYPNMYRSRRKRTDLKLKEGKLGFSTTGVSKDWLNKALIDGLGEGGYTVYSSRFYKEAMIYVQLTPKKTGAEPGPGNNDDLMIGTGLALVAIPDAIRRGSHNLIPFHNMDVPLSGPREPAAYDKMIAAGGARDLLMPVGMSSELPTNRVNVDEEVRKFQDQMGGIAISNKAKNNVRTVKFKRNKLDWPRRPKK